MPAPVREQTSKRSNKRTIGWPKPRTLLRASQHRQLVSQQHELDLLGELGPSTPNEQPQNGSEGKVGEREEHRPILPRPRNRSHQVAVLAPFSGFWYSRASSRPASEDLPMSGAATEPAAEANRLESCRRPNNPDPFEPGSEF
jgi:hypothetical protein